MNKCAISLLRGKIVRNGVFFEAISENAPLWGLGFKVMCLVFLYILRYILQCILRYILLYILRYILRGTLLPPLRELLAGGLVLF